MRGFNVDGINGCIKRYRFLFEEFEVDYCVFSKEMSIIYFVIVGFFLFLVMEGIGMIRICFFVEKFYVGDILFVFVNIKLCLELEIWFEVYRVGVNSKFL